MTTPIKPPRTKFLTKSLTTGFFDLPSSSPDAGSVDRNTSKPCLKVRSQSVNQERHPNPLPGSDLHSESLDRAPCPGLSSNTTTESNSQNRATEDDRSPCPDRPPLIPPKSKTVISRMSSASVNSGDYDTLKTSHVMPSHSGYENAPRSPRPPRPERPPSHTLSRSPSGFGTTPPQLELLPQSNTQNRATEDQQSPCPARQPPVPPKSKAVISRMSSASANSGDYDTLKTSHVKPPDTKSERVLPPLLPPPRSERPPLPVISHSSSVYERTLPQKELLPKLSESRYENMQRSPRPPRPERPPSLTPSHSPSRFETPPPQLELHRTQSSEGYFCDDRRPSPVLIKTRSLSTYSPSSGPPAGYNSPRRASTGTYKHPCPAVPPPPSFNPPPPPAASRYSPYSSPTVYDTESLYSEIDERPYLEILPEENEHRFQPSYSVYRAHCGPSTMTHSQSQLEPRYINTCFAPRTPVTEDMEDFESLMRWMRTVEYRENTPLSLYGLSVVQETREFNQRALHVKKGLCLFNYLLIKRNDSLRSHIFELNSIAGTLEKVKSKSKKLGIAAGTTGIVGVVSVIAGIALAPVTMGASLVATAVGAGLVAGSGGMGVSGMMHKKSKPVDRKRVEKVVEDYRADITDVERCLSLIRTGMDNLRQHDVCRLQGAGVDPEALRTATVAHNLHRSAVYQAVGRTTYTGGVSSESLLETFTKNLDSYFTENDGKLKLGTDTKFACQVRLLAQGLLEVLNELNKIWETFTSATNI